ncbi:hypothetical protein M3Y99_01669500 [Aphelenchoides fujianensis]|nr:hypothetical protein M3Y99_01669500 [Aphelenchoides fujianensis]
MGGGLDLTGIPEISGMMAGGGNGGFMGGGMNGGIAGGITSSGITNPTANTPAGMGSLMGRFSPQPSMNGFGSGIVGYGSYMPPNVYETSNYPVQWPMGGGLTNIAGTGGNLGYGMENYGPTGAMPADYLGMGTMGMTPMPAPTPYGYSGVNYPMAPSVYPPNVMPQIYQPVTAATGPPTTPPELSSKSREKSSQESSATSHEHLQASQSPPPATSIQALTQQIRRLPAVLYVDSKDGEGRHVENLLRDTYGLPLVSFYVDKIDKPKVVEKYLHQLTAHKGMPYLFICGTFIGSQEHIENYHKQKQIPQLVEVFASFSIQTTACFQYVCGEEKDKKTGHRQSSHKESTKKRKSSGRHKSRRPSKLSSSRTSNRR